MEGLVEGGSLVDMLGAGQPTPSTPEDLSTTVYQLHPVSVK